MKAESTLNDQFYVWHGPFTAATAASASKRKRNEEKSVKINKRPTTTTSNNPKKLEPPENVSTAPNNTGAKDDVGGVERNGEKKGNLCPFGA